LNAGGTSIKKTVTLKSKILKQMAFKYWFNRGFGNDKFKLKYKIMPIAFVYNTVAFTQLNCSIYL
jgi:hypothetical protein